MSALAAQVEASFSSANVQPRALRSLRYFVAIAWTLRGTASALPFGLSLAGSRRGAAAVALATGEISARSLPVSGSRILLNREEFHREATAA